jgi:NADH-quinone oxidoreductase subunit E
MSSFAFTPENKQALDALMTRYPEKRALTLPALWTVQLQQGYLDEPAIEHVARTLELPYMHVYSVATFYTMFRFDAPPKVTVEVCRTLSCELCGKDALMVFLKERYGIGPGERTEDGSVELLEVECMGACGGAPMAAVNGKYRENLTPEALEALLKEQGC